MSSEPRVIVARRLGRGAAALLLVLAAFFQPGSSHGAGEPNLPLGVSRIWIYREYEPFQTLARPYVRFNGAVTAISEPGGAFYRDVPAGTYTVSVDSDGVDVNQFATVAVVPGQHVYIKILSLAGWYSGGGNRNAGWARDTFYTWVIPPQTAQVEIAHLPL